MSRCIFEELVDGPETLPVTRFLDAVCVTLTSTRGVAVALTGELGAGKTTFVRGCACELKIPPTNITSPTYTLQQVYPVPDSLRYPALKGIEHWDLYRLGDLPPELLERVPVGIVQLVEWGDKFEYEVDFSLHFTLHEDGRRRIVLRRASLA